MFFLSIYLLFKYLFLLLHEFCFGFEFSGCLLLPCLLFLFVWGLQLITSWFSGGDTSSVHFAAPFMYLVCSKSLMCVSRCKETVGSQLFASVALLRLLPLRIRALRVSWAFRGFLCRRTARPPKGDFRPWRHGGEKLLGRLAREE